MGAKTATFTGHKDCVYTLEKGKGENLFFSSGADGMVICWDVENPEEGKMIARLTSPVYALHFLPYTNQLIIAANNDGFHVIDLETKQELWAAAAPETWFRMEPISSQVILATGSKGRYALIHLEEQKVEFFSFGSSDIRALAYNPVLNQMAMGNSDGQIGFWQNYPGLVSPLPEHHSKSVFGLTFYPDGSRLVSCGRDARLILWNKIAESLWQPEVNIPAHLFGIHDVKLHPEKPILATCSMDKTLKIWDAENLKLLRVLDKTRHAGHGHSINQLLWLGKRELLLSCSDDRTISAWNIYT